MDNTKLTTLCAVSLTAILWMGGAEASGDMCSVPSNSESPIKTEFCTLEGSVSGLKGDVMELESRDAELMTSIETKASKNQVNSLADQVEEQKMKSDNNERRITNLEQKDHGHGHSDGIALAMAMSQVQFSDTHNVSISGGLGSYSNEREIALGVQFKINDNFFLRASKGSGAWATGFTMGF